MTSTATSPVPAAAAAPSNPHAGKTSSRAPTTRRPHTGNAAAARSSSSAAPRPAAIVAVSSVKEGERAFGRSFNATELKQFDLVRELKPDWTTARVLDFCKKHDFDEKAISHELTAEFEFERTAHDPSSEEWVEVPKKEVKKARDVAAAAAPSAGKFIPAAERAKAAAAAAAAGKTNGAAVDGKPRPRYQPSAASDRAFALMKAKEAKEAKEKEERERKKEVVLPVPGKSFLAALVKPVAAPVATKANNGAAKTNAAAAATEVAAAATAPKSEEKKEEAAAKSSKQTPPTAAATPADAKTAPTVAAAAAPNANKPVWKKKEAEAAAAAAAAPVATAAATTTPATVTPAATPATTTTTTTAAATPVTSAPIAAAPVTPAATTVTPAPAAATTTPAAVATPVVAAATVAAPTATTTEAAPTSNPSSRSNSIVAPAAAPVAAVQKPAPTPAVASPVVNPRVNDLFTSEQKVLLPSHIQAASAAGTFQFGAAGSKPSGPRAPKPKEAAPAVVAAPVAQAVQPVAIPAAIGSAARPFIAAAPAPIGSKLPTHIEPQSQAAAAPHTPDNEIIAGGHTGAHHFGTALHDDAHLGASVADAAAVYDNSQYSQFHQSVAGQSVASTYDAQYTQSQQPQQYDLPLQKLPPGKPLHHIPQPYQQPMQKFNKPQQQQAQQQYQQQQNQQPMQQFNPNKQQQQQYQQQPMQQQQQFNQNKPLVGGQPNSPQFNQSKANVAPGQQQAAQSTQQQQQVPQQQQQGYNKQFNKPNQNTPQAYNNAPYAPYGGYPNQYQYTAPQYGQFPYQQYNPYPYQQAPTPFAQPNRFPAQYQQSFGGYPGQISPTFDQSAYGNTDDYTKQQQQQHMYANQPTGVQANVGTDGQPLLSQANPQAGVASYDAAGWGQDAISGPKSSVKADTPADLNSRMGNYSAGFGAPLAGAPVQPYSFQQQSQSHLIHPQFTQPDQQRYQQQYAQWGGQ